ncbi:uncharacterized protein [Rutidosis leptorrhynchoides]|uniref:uncharacterized protein n=1 Tax=Rutidosis leptorrhynchoides TaxID=125765 RepID=UPI003A99C683
MWTPVIFGFFIFRFASLVFDFDDDDDDDDDEEHIDLGTTGSNALFAVADRLQALYRGKVYVGLRIPDSDTASRQNIDLVLVTKREAVVVSVINASGIVSIDGDGTCVCIDRSKNKTERLQDPMVEAKKQVAVLESYFEQRGVALPDGYLSCKIICPNPNFRTIHPDYFPPEVVSNEQWAELKHEKKSLSGWIKGALRCGNKETQKSIQQNLSYILSTAPMWDRLELNNNEHILGEFLEFKGKKDDIVNIKRSKVSRMIVQETSKLDIGDSKIRVLCAPRDYRNEGALCSEWNEVTFGSSTEVLFQLQDTAKIQKIKLSLILSISLSP